MQSNYYKGVEFFLFFILLPISFLWSYSPGLKVGFTIIGFIYILSHLYLEGVLKTKFPKKIVWRHFFKEAMIKLLIIAIVTTLYVYFIAPDKLFAVLLKKPSLWGIILLVYTFLSVWPQEVIYRTFFFKRYTSLITNKWLLIFINAIVFSLAHIFLKSALVQILTFIGGLLFAYTYHKTKSTTIVSIEHAIYGNWLFTVGMGGMLAFPEA